MMGGRNWWTIRRLALASGVLLAAWCSLGLYSYATREETYQRRLALWGGRSREIPAESHPFGRFRIPIRRYLGDRVYFMLIGSSGRAVGNGNQFGTTPDGKDATPAQLAELLEAQPIRSAWLAGSKHLGDEWVSGIKNPESMINLSLDGSEVTDRSAEVIATMHNLYDLSLVDTAIPDAAVFRLCRLPKLDRFSVGGPNIRSIRLVDHRLLDESGAPATCAKGKLRLEGLIEMAGLPGATENIRVEIRHADDPAVPHIALRQELHSIERESPRSYRFRIDLVGLLPARSTVEVWIDHRPGFTTALVQYRMLPFSIELAAPESPAIDVVR